MSQECGYHYCRRKNGTTCPSSAEQNLPYLRVGVPADDQADRPRGALAQDRMNLAQSCMANIDGIHLQDLISTAGGKSNTMVSEHRRSASTKSFLKST